MRCHKDDFLKPFVGHQLVDHLEITQRVECLHVTICVTYTLVEEVLEGYLHEALRRAVRAEVLVYD